MHQIARIIDANGNRAREALRVMEESARFLLDDVVLAGALKSMRHDLTTTISEFAVNGTTLIAGRNTLDDVGTTIVTPGESARSSARDVVHAAGNRLGEALRAIEEYGKSIDAKAAGRIEQMRYHGYESQKQLLLRLPSDRVRQWSVCVLLTADLCPNGDWRSVAIATLRGGADCIQLREKDTTDSVVLDRARALRDMTNQYNAALLVNDRADIAHLAKADGVHLGQGDLTPADVRSMFGDELIIGVSTHDMEEAAHAVNAGADYCGVGAMFATSGKPDRAPSGPAYLRAFIERYPHKPHLAIGGIDATNISELAVVGCRGVAVSSTVCQSDDPRAVVERLRNSLDLAEVHAPDEAPMAQYR